MEIKHSYRHDAALRGSFNALAEKTFGLNFEAWYQNGFWGDNYDPYSLILDGKVVANVSLSRTDLLVDGEVKRIYQLGTVMTEEGYRNRGFIRAIMAEIEKDTAGADGIYLFANDSVVDFYPKFGFREEKEHVYRRSVSQETKGTMAPVAMDCPAQWAILTDAMAASQFREGCRMVGNPGLIFFYISQFMQDQVYYSRDLDAYAVAEMEDGNLTLHNVFSPNELPLEQVIAAFGSGIHSVTLGFTPADAAAFTAEVLHDEDTTFFVKGEFFADFASRQLRIPTLSRA